MMSEKRKLAAIMFTDIVGYTALMSKDEQKAMQVLQKKRDVLKPLIKKYNGEWLKKIGDRDKITFLQGAPLRKLGVIDGQMNVPGYKSRSTSGSQGQQSMQRRFGRPARFPKQVRQKQQEHPRDQNQTIETILSPYNPVHDTTFLPLMKSLNKSSSPMSMTSTWSTPSWSRIS